MVDKGNKKSNAAQKIIARASKLKEIRDKEKRKKEQEIKEKEKRKNKIEVFLDKKLAFLLYLLNNKIVEEQDIVKAFFKSEKEKRDIIEILKEEKEIELKKDIKEGKYLVNLTKPNKMDFLLSDIILKNNILTREEMQSLLRIQADLKKLGINRDLERLLIISKKLDENMVSSLIYECQKKVAQSLKEKYKVQEKKVSDRFIKSKTYNKVSYFLGFLFSFIFIFILFFYFMVSFFYSKNKSIRKDKSSTNINLTEEDKEKIVKEYLKKIKEQKNQKILKRKREIKKIKEVLKYTKKKEKKYAKWGKYIVFSTEEEFLAKNWQVGTNLKNLKIELLNYNIKVFEKKLRKGVSIRGKFNTPFLLPTLQPLIRLYICHPLNPDRPYVIKKSLLKDNGILEENIYPLKKKFVKGIYILKINILPSDQRPIVRYFLNINHKYSWSIIFLYGKKKEIINNYIKEYKKLLELLNNIENICKDLFYKKITQEEFDKNIVIINNKLTYHILNILIPYYPSIIKKIYNILKKITNLNTINIKGKILLKIIKIKEKLILKRDKIIKLIKNNKK